MDVLMMTVLIGQLDDMGACRLYGSLNVNKVASNLHITSDGHGYASNQHTSHDCKWFRSAFQHDQLIWQCIVLNFTHRIDEFSFGQLYPNLINPLDNSIEISETRMLGITMEHAGSA